MTSNAPVLEGDTLRAAIRAVMDRNLDLDEHDVFIFGSEADRSPSPRSDIDVGVLGPHPVSNVVMRQIREELEGLRTLRVFNVVDLGKTDDSFRDVAFQNAERL